MNKWHSEETYGLDEINLLVTFRFTRKENINKYK